MMLIETLFYFSGAVTIFWCVPTYFRTYALLVLSLGFMLWVSPYSFILLFALVGLNFRGPFLPRLLFLGTIFFVYKAFLSRFFQSTSTEIVWLGTAYYSLKAVHYLVETQLGRIPKHSFLEYLCYMCFFPCLFVGPIHPFPAFQTQLSRIRFDVNFFSRGLERIVFGLFKIVVLTKFLLNHKALLWVQALPSNSPLTPYLECVLYGLNLYFQFSGYTDIAIGYGLLLGIQLPENFNFPLFKRNIIQFWQSWHISLTEWCRNYVYMPLVSITRKPSLAILTAMLTIGLWHEFSFRYILWGFYHTFGIFVFHLYQKIKPSFLSGSKSVLLMLSTRALAIFLTFNFVILGFAITKENSIRATLHIYKKIFAPILNIHVPLP